VTWNCVGSSRTPSKCPDRSKPFGPIPSYTLGDRQMVNRTYGANYAMTDVVSPALELHFSRDAMGNRTLNR